MIENILMYGVEIWGWKEQEEVEKAQGKYLRGVLEVDRETPGYIMREECKRNRLRVKAEKRVQSLKKKWMEGKSAGYERNAGEKKTRRKMSGKYYQKNRDKDTDKQERKEKSKNPDTTGSMKEEIPEYLPEYLGRKSAKERKKMAIFRCGNEERKNRYWMEKEESRMCYERERKGEKY
ncbi:hypothetical protein GEV33_001080 [Tenebrio molitor]|uniref:Uncharacterized protein n=1 Tax=Tenebrio molitor TaxID=7067 RepID=A0A8J6HXU3_TENMO|nr:hypothetical protein GEV33_001080 [Tenebrio molitor]